jgi:hypothetical protein
MSDMKTPVEELLEKVVDQRSFFAFVEGLIQDSAENPADWVNTSATDFLEAALAWGRDSRLTEQASWRTFADILYAGCCYE